MYEMGINLQWVPRSKLQGTHTDRFAYLPEITTLSNAM